ncbi:MAG: acyl-CoA dehydrogenase family protein [Streptosporangiaceae bacterium]
MFPTRIAAFVQQRVQGGRILIKHQAVAVRVAAMATKLEAVSTQYPGGCFL